MLEISIPETEVYNERTQEFSVLPSLELSFEHSLVSLSKWEMIWEKPFLSNVEKTDEEVLSYLLCMCLTPKITMSDIRRLSIDQRKQLSNYIDKSASATTFHNQRPAGSSRELITSELIYYWMVAQQIPFECENWHLNRLTTLIKICGIKSSPPKKMSRSEMLAQRQQLNAQRRSQMGSRG